MSVDTKHVRCILCGDPATHIVAYLRPRGLPAKHYAYCSQCSHENYYALVTPLTNADGSLIVP